jgi:Uma2 family endonuclease
MANALMTYDAYAALPDDGKRYEVIEGELCLVPAPNMKHAQVSRNLAFALWAFVSPRKQGQVFLAPFDVILSETNVLQPDVLYVSKNRLNILSQIGASGAPDIAAEVLSPSTRRRDEVTKLRLYESFGVDEYWIVDLAKSAIRTYRRSGKKLAQVAELANEKGVTLTTPLLPGLAIPLEAIFED